MLEIIILAIINMDILIANNLRFTLHESNSDNLQICKQIMEEVGWKVKLNSEGNLLETNTSNIVLVHDENEIPIGFARFYISPFGEVWLFEICVIKAWQKKNVGRALVSFIKNEIGERIVYAWITEGSENFYQRLGFKRSKAPVYYLK